MEECHPWRYAGGRDVTGIVHEWRRLSREFADANGIACAAAEGAKAAIRIEAERGVSYSALTVAKIDNAVELLGQARQLMLQLTEVHTKLFPNDRKIFDVKATIETSVESMETLRDRLRPN